MALCRESCTTHQPSPPERTSFVPIDATAIVGSQMNESPSSAPSVHNQQTPSRGALDQYDWSNTLAGRRSCPEPFPKHLGLDQLRSEPNRWYARNFVLLTTSWLSLTSLARQLLPSWYEYGVILSPLSWIAIYLSRLPRVGHSSNRTLTRFLRTCGFEVL